MDIHAYPVNDLKRHDTESRSCACRPAVELYSNGNAVVVHNSWDCREIREKALDHAFNEGKN